MKPVFSRKINNFSEQSICTCHFSIVFPYFKGTFSNSNRAERRGSEGYGRDLEEYCRMAGDIVWVFKCVLVINLCFAHECTVL